MMMRTNSSESTNSKSNQKKRGCFKQFWFQSYIFQVASTMAEKDPVECRVRLRTFLGCSGK